MSYLVGFPTFAGKASISKTDLETAWRKVVQAIGGTSYTAGTPTTANGTLDASNFRPDAGIANQNKTQPRTAVCLRSTVGDMAVGDTRNLWFSWTIPQNIGGITGDFKLYTMELSYSGKDAGTSATFAFTIYQNGSAITATLPISTLAVLTPATPYDISALPGSPILKPGDTLMVQLVLGSGAGGLTHVYGLECSIWGSFLHVG